MAGSTPACREPGRAIRLPRSAVRRGQLGSRLWHVPPPHPGLGLQGSHQLFPRATWWGARARALENVPPRLWPPGAPHSGPHTPMTTAPHAPSRHPPRFGCGPFSSRCLGFGVLNSCLCRFWGGCVTRISVLQRVEAESRLCVCSFPRLEDGVTASQRSTCWGLS